MKMDEMAPKNLPLVEPRVFPERLALARKGPRRIDLVPRSPRLAGEPAHVGKRERMFAAIAGEIGYPGRRLACIGSAAGEPLPELLERAGVVVVPLLFVEERIQIRIGVQRDADEELRMLVRKRHDLAPGGLQVAPFVMPILCRIGVEGQRAGEF